MEQIFSYIFHIDQYIIPIISGYREWIYGILFCIVLFENISPLGVIVPGDSFLFLMGTLTGSASMHTDVNIIVGVSIVASIIGEYFNYELGYNYGNRCLHNKHWKIITEKHLQRFNTFYKRYGEEFLMISQLLSLLRSLSPFISGIEKMNRMEFMLYNVAGSIVWVCGCSYIGFFFGNIPFIQENMRYFILGFLIFIFCFPIVELIKYLIKRHKL